MIENDVSEMGGEAVIFETRRARSCTGGEGRDPFSGRPGRSVSRVPWRCADFEKEIAKEIAINKFTYAELEREDTDLKKLQGWLQKIKKLDFCGAPLAGRKPRHA